ncbi:response regulator transcription factor [Paenibacillus beijingensis]|uniref:AraC family transcriptional regulator n=1 Tax=Paenibacillus beijingensis TaxID=1126833 RepID=A0A0D5NJI7_9BACL|nr:response regulator [Paenibacillus beijingensis]AJY75431.1 hypothetical protein VN24_13705 [Paenibacillus beijingensis]
MFNVMLVDDEPLVREFLRAHFRQHHPEWKIAAEAMDGQEAWEKLQECRIDLVISDIKMPVMNGIELSRLIHRMEAPPQMVILSGYDEFALAQEALRSGVCNYLLKPVVKEELMEAIHSVTSLLELRNRESLAFYTENSISKESRAQVIKQFLKAVISDSGVEIKTLYPLIYRLKVQLIETEGMIMLLDLDEQSLIERGVPCGDFPIFRFILQQAAAEIAEEDAFGNVFLDEEQLTSVLVTGDDEAQILQRCTELYRRVADAMAVSTGIAVSGGLGSLESELFHLHTSYAAAARNLQCRLLTGQPALFGQREAGSLAGRLKAIDQAAAEIRHALFNRNETAAAIALGSYIDQMRLFTSNEVVTFGIHLTKSIAAGKRELYGQRMNKACRRLQRVFQEQRASWEAESVLAVFRDIAASFSAGQAKPEALDETDIGNRAKAYIYAHYAEPLSLALLADKLGVSQGYLSNTFHRTVGETYVKFLTRIRMEQAAKLLQASPPEKVYDVAEKVGYVGVKHFSHVFKQHFGLPPGEYQEQHLSARRT